MNPINGDVGIAATNPQFTIHDFPLSFINYQLLIIQTLPTL